MKVRISEFSLSAFFQLGFIITRNKATAHKDELSSC